MFHCFVLKEQIVLLKKRKFYYYCYYLLLLLWSLLLNVKIITLLPYYCSTPTCSVTHTHTFFNIAIPKYSALCNGMFLSLSWIRYCQVMKNIVETYRHNMVKCMRGWYRKLGLLRTQTVHRCVCWCDLITSRICVNLSFLSSLWYINAIRTSCMSP